MADCAASVVLTDTQGTPLPRPITPGASGRLTLTAGQTNVLTLTGAELDNLSEITFTNQPTASTPLLVNVVGNFSGTTPNLAGVSGTQAPFMLWNFATASSIVVTGGATLEGTIYAPSANLIWDAHAEHRGQRDRRQLHPRPAARAARPSARSTSSRSPRRCPAPARPGSPWSRG